MSATKCHGAPAALMGNYARAPILFDYGVGSHLWDVEGRRYLDAFAGIAVNSLGHAHPGWVAAIREQAGRLAHCSNSYRIETQEALAAKLVRLAFPSQAMFCNSGAEAIEAAIKLVRLWNNLKEGGQRKRILAFSGAFHGRTLAALGLTANSAYRAPFAPMTTAEFLPWGDGDALMAAMGDDVAAIFVEPIQGEGGVRLPPPGFLKLIRAATHKWGALMVLDEVQTGVGRTGKMFAYEHEDIFPDLLVLAKGLGGGMPIGALLAATPLALLLRPGLHGSTFGGNPLACAAAMAVLSEVERPQFLQRITQMGDKLQECLRRVFGPSHEVRGRGLMVGVQLQSDPRNLVHKALACGLLVGSAANQTLRLTPPLIFDEEEIGELQQLMTQALELCDP